MRIVLGLLLLVGCDGGTEPDPLPAPDVPPQQVWAEIYASGERRGDVVLYWPTLPSALPIAVHTGTRFPSVVPWTDPVPAGDPVTKIVGWVGTDVLDDIRQRVATGGLPRMAPPVLVDMEVRPFPDLPLGEVAIVEPFERGSATQFALLVHQTGNRATFAVEKGRQVASPGSVPPLMVPRDQDQRDDQLALDAVVSDGIAVGDPVRLVWPEGMEHDDPEVAEGAYLFLGLDERGWAKIGTLRYVKHLTGLRAKAGEPPVLVPDERVALTVPLRETPDPSRMTQTTHLTDGTRRSHDFPYAAVGDHAITVVVPAEDADWIRYWIRVSGGTLALARLRTVDRSGFDPPPPGFPANTKLRR